MSTRTGLFMETAMVNPPFRGGLEKTRVEDIGEMPHRLEASIHEYFSSMSIGPPPALPEKSSRRRTWCPTTQHLDYHDVPTVPVPPSSQWAQHDVTESFRASRPNYGQLPRSYSYSSDESSPAESDPSTEPRTSMSSRTTWSDAPSDDDWKRQTWHAADKNAPMAMSQAERDQLRAEYPDDEADLASLRSYSLYSQTDDADVASVPRPLAYGRTLYINATGPARRRFSLRSEEPKIQVGDRDGIVGYISSRSEYSSGDTSLRKPGCGEYVRTTHGKATTLTYQSDGVTYTMPFTPSGKGIRRSQPFTIPGSNGGEFEWRSIGSSAKDARGKHLALAQIPPPPSAPATLTAAPSPKEDRRLSVTRRFTRSFSSIGRSASMHGRRPSTSSRVPEVETKQVGLAPPTNPRVLAQLLKSDTPARPQINFSRPFPARANVGDELIIEPGCTDLVPEELVVAMALVMLRPRKLTSRR